MSSRRYRLYGLTLQSRLVLPCRRAGGRSVPDVRLLPGTRAQFREARAGARRPPEWFECRRLADGVTHVSWTDHFEFLVSADGSRIFYRALAHASRESLSVHLLGHVLSFSLLARGCDPLHGTVVEVGDHAIAFVGDCGRGKSTLAAALLACGHRIVTDDVVAFRVRKETWLVHPGIPRLKLSPTIARALLGNADRGAPMLHGVAKLVIPLSPGQAVASMRRLKAIYVLDDPDSSRAREAVSVEPLSARDGFLELVRAAFNLVVSDRNRLANQFASAERLARHVPVKRLVYPRDLSRLPAVCRAVVADAAAL